MKLTASYPWLYCDRGLYSKGIAMDIDENCPEFQEYIKQNYEDHDGKLFNKRLNRYNTTISSNGYYVFNLCRKTVYVHRIIWFLNKGSFPKDMIDHIDHNRINNKISNLREATNAQNQWNVTKSIKNSTGYKNVSWKQKDKLYEVQIHDGTKLRYCGCFKKLEDAIKCADENRKKLHGEFAHD